MRPSLKSKGPSNFQRKLEKNAESGGHLGSFRQKKNAWFFEEVINNEIWKLIPFLRINKSQEYI